MIKSFKCADTMNLFFGTRVARFVNIEKSAQRKLNLLDSVKDVNELRVPPGNRLEQLKGDRAGQWSIRINDQFRVCFKWNDGNAEEVEIVDYH